MKKMICLLCAAVVSVMSYAAGMQKITVAKRESRLVEPGFKVEHFKVEGQKSLITVEPAGGGVRVTGQEEGVCSVVLMGSGNMESVVEITVGKDLLKAQRGLMEKFEIVGVSGVEVTRVNDSLTVSGEVSDPSAWKKLKNILRNQAEPVEDYTQFRVLPDTLKALRDQFKAEGFSITENAASMEPGKVNIQYVPNTLIVSGTVFSPTDKERILRILGTQSSWLWLEGYSSASREDWQTIGRLNVSVDQQLLHMDVVLLSYKEDSNFEAGTGSRPVISAAFSSFLDLIKGKIKNDTFMINADLNSTLDFLKEQGLVRQSVGGYMRFKSNDKEKGRLKIGGTMKVKLQSATAEGLPTQNFQDIEYGFIVEKIEGGLVSDSKVTLKLNIEKKIPLIMADGYDIQERSINPVIDCPLGKTVVLGGYTDMQERTRPPSGFPILRNVPLLNWFVAQEKEESAEDKIMFLVNVRAVNPDEPESQSARLPYEEAKNLTTEVQVDNQQRLENRKFHGILYFLNWFMP